MSDERNVITDDGTETETIKMSNQTRIEMDWWDDDAGNTGWRHDPDLDGTLAEFREANKEDDQTIEALDMLEAGADEAVLGGGAASLSRLRAVRMPGRVLS